MPIYAFYCDACGARFEDQRSMDSPDLGKARCFNCGKVARRDYHAEQAGMDNTCWEPQKYIHSQAMAVHPSQIPEARAFNKSMGVPTTDYDRTGAPVFTSRRHQKLYGEAWGAGKLDAGYGDPTPVNSRERTPQHEHEIGGPGFHPR